MTAEIPEGTPVVVPPGSEVAAEDDDLPWNDPVKAEKYAKELRAEARSWRLKAAEFKPLAEKWKAKEDSEKTESEKLREETARLKEQSDQSALEVLQYRVALDTGCPAEFIPLLRGTQEEMTAKAMELSEKYGQPASAVSDGRPKPALKFAQPKSEETSSIDDFLRQAGRR